MTQLFCVLLAGKCPSMKQKPQELSWRSSSLSVWLWEPLYPSASGPWSKTSVRWRRLDLRHIQKRICFCIYQRVREIFFFSLRLFVWLRLKRTFITFLCGLEQATIECVPDIIQQWMKESSSSSILHALVSHRTSKPVSSASLSVLFLHFVCVYCFVYCAKSFKSFCVTPIRLGVFFRICLL